MSETPQDRWPKTVARMGRTILLVVTMYLISQLVSWYWHPDASSVQRQLSFIGSLAVLLVYRVMKLEDPQAAREGKAG